MQTTIIEIYGTEIPRADIENAASVIRDGGLVVFPTETVYGLGGNGLDAEAAMKIYAAKGRPSDNPLIIHVAKPEDAYLYTETDEVTRPLYEALAKAFMPGPLTVILPKRDCVPYSTTGGLDTVAVRMPSHPVALSMLRACNLPIAAPSANRSGKPSPTIDIRELRVDRELGAGSFGTVFAGKYLGRDVAIKFLRGRSQADIDEFRREVDILMQVRGANVVVFYGSVQAPPDYCHVTELMDLGSLTTVVQASAGALDPVLKVKMLADIAKGMAVVHSFSIIHRDLKPDNVLCHSPLSLTNADLCKITDFGSSRSVLDGVSMTMTKNQGTPLYMAPEILAGEQHYDWRVDAYSYGIVMAFVVNDGEQPYADFTGNHVKLMGEIIDGLRPTIRQEMPETVQAVMEKSWSGNPAERLPFSQILTYLDVSSVFPSTSNVSKTKGGYQQLE